MRRGTLDRVQQIGRQADPFRQRPRPVSDRATMTVQLHRVGTQRQLVELVAQRFSIRPLDRQAWYLITRFENLRAQAADESGPLGLLPP